MPSTGSRRQEKPRLGPDVGSLSASALTTEMTQLEQALVNIIGSKPTYMRSPRLEMGGSVQSVMKTPEYRVVTDDVDTGDWHRNTPA